MKKRIPVLPLLILAFVLLATSSYIYSALHTLFPSSGIPQFFWVLTVAIFAGFGLAISRRHKNAEGKLLLYAAHALLILVVAELVTILFLIPGDLYSTIVSQPRSYNWTLFSAVIFVLTVLLFLYGMIIGKYRYTVKKVTLEFDDLPPLFDGFKIVQISDVHAGSFKNKTAVKRGISLINAQHADLFVFTGDLVNNKAEEIKPWIPEFSKIKAPYGQYSILGNHDYGDYISWPTPEEKTQNLQELKEAHRHLGFELLLDRHVAIKNQDEQLILGGVENWGVGFGERGDLAKTFQHVPEQAFKILLSHDPSHWETQVKKSYPIVHLTLSGHTHGMQFGLEAFGIKWSPVKYRYAHWAGLKEENGRKLYINRGFGFIGFSGRIGIWPEITVLELKRRNKK